MLGLRFCARALSSCGKRGPLFITVRGPLSIVASPAAEHRLQTRRLSNCGSRAQLLRSTWDPPRPGLEPASPALAGRLSTTAPPGKPLCFLNDVCRLFIFNVIIDIFRFRSIILFFIIFFCFWGFFKRFFWCGPFLKSLLNLSQYCFCFMFWPFGRKPCGILAPWPGIEPAPPALEGKVSTTGPPGKSLLSVFNSSVSPFLSSFGLFEPFFSIPS